MGKKSEHYKYTDPMLESFIKKQMKSLPKYEGKATGNAIQDSMSKRNFTQSQRAELENKYYKEVYPKQQKQMLDNFVANNPGSSVSVKKDKKGRPTYTLKTSNGKKMDFPDPRIGNDSSRTLNRESVRNLAKLDAASKGKEFNPKTFKKEFGVYKPPKSGGNVFSDIGKMASGALSSVKDVAKNLMKAPTSIAGQSLTGVGNLVGNKQISSLGKNVQRESEKGIDTYGDTAIDVGANLATGGAYGIGQNAATALQTGDLSSFNDPKMLAGLAAGQLGLSPDITQGLQAGLSVAKDPKKGLVSAASGYTGVDEQYLKAGGDVLGGKDITKVGTNLALDKSGLSSPVKDLIKGKTPDKIARSIAGNQVKDSNMAYTIKQGDSLSKIAAQNGVSVQELLAANPNIKDPNRILAGANLNIPGQEEQLPTPLPNEGEFNPEDTVSAPNEGFVDDGGSVIDRTKNVKGETLKKGTFLENVKRELGNFGDTLVDNRNLVGTGVGLAGAGLGYKAGQQGYDEYIKDIGRQEDYLSKQFKPTVTSPDLLKYKEDPNVKSAQEQTFDFYKQRMEMGETPQEREQRLKAREEQSQFAQGQRQAGLDLQARTAGGAATGGASLAASLLGAQGASNRLAADERNIQAEAFKNKEQAAGRMGDLARTRLQDEFSRAQTTSQEKSQFQKDLFNQKYMQGKSVADLKAQEAGAKLGKKGAEAQFYNTAATTINTGIGAAGQRKDEQAAIGNRAADQEKQRQHERELAQINSGNKEQVNRPTKPVQTTTPPPRQSAVQPKPLPQQTAPQQAQQPYTVRGGDTLSALAKRYNTSVQDIQKKNKDITDPNKIRIGQKINF